MKALLIIALAEAYSLTAIPQEAVPTKPVSVGVEVARLLDVCSGRYVENAAVWIEHGIIKEAGHFDKDQLS
jgi:hypothetical protein